MGFFSEKGKGRHASMTPNPSLANKTPFAKPCPADIENLLIAKRLSDQYELSIENMKINDIAGSGVYINELNVKNSF